MSGSTGQNKEFLETESGVIVAVSVGTVLVIIVLVLITIIVISYRRQKPSERGE